MNKSVSRVEAQKKSDPKGAAKKPTQSTTADGVKTRPGGKIFKIFIKAKTARGALSLKHAPAGVSTRTLRLRKNLGYGLAFLRPMIGVSTNEMINRAVGEYVERETATVENALGDLLKQVRAYRKADPDFRYAKSQVVAGELAMAGKDTTDGTVVIEDSLTPTPVAPRARKHG